MYSVLKKNIANMPEAANSITTFAVSSERTRKIESRTSGAFERSSITTNAVSSATATRKKPTVFADPQPSDSVFTIA